MIVPAREIDIARLQERITELEKQVFQLRQEYAACIESNAKLTNAEETVSAKLRAVEGLPEKWRDDENNVRGRIAARNSYQCATELEAALNPPAD